MKINKLMVKSALKPEAYISVPDLTFCGMNYYPFPEGMVIHCKGHCQVSQTTHQHKGGQGKGWFL